MSPADHAAAFSLAGHRALVTGGAQGIGRATALSLAAGGARWRPTCRRNAGRALVNEAEAVTATALDYFEGWYAADVDRVDSALHSQLVKRSAGQV